MKNRFLITEYKNKRICAVYEDDIPVELIFSEGNGFSVGNIYVGRVERIVKNLNAAFVSISADIKGYLPMKNPDELKTGAEIAVQIEKEAIKSKELRLTEDISLGGRYLALTKGRPGIGISKKITDEETRRNLKDSFLSFVSEDKSLEFFFASGKYGMVIRTAAAKAEASELKKELRSIVEKLSAVEDHADKRTVYSCLYRERDSYLRRIRDTAGEIERIVTDIPEIYRDCLDYFLDRTELQERIVFYEDEMLPLIKLYSLETVIQEALQKKVWLKSGGFLVIEPTEALTVIDVNSGKNIRGRNKQKLIYETNLEAVYEGARQLRLRNISGIIIIDFINMCSKEYQSELISELKRVLKNDRIETRFIDLTPLGLAELTREKIQKPLYEVMQSV